MDEQGSSFADGKARLACIQCYRCSEPPMDISDFYEHYAKNHMDVMGYPEGFHSFSCDACGKKFQTQLFAMAHSRRGCSVERNKVRFVADLTDDTTMRCMNHIQTALNICVEFCDKDTNSVLRRLWERIKGAQLLENKNDNVAVEVAPAAEHCKTAEEPETQSKAASEVALLDGQSSPISESEIHAADYTVETTDVITAEDSFGKNSMHYEDDHVRPSTNFNDNGNGISDHKEHTAHDASLFDDLDGLEVEEAVDDDDDDDLEESISGSNDEEDDHDQESISSDSGMADHHEDANLDNDDHRSMEEFIASRIHSSPVRTKKRRWDAPADEHSPHKRSQVVRREISVHTDAQHSIRERVTRPSTSSGYRQAELGHDPSSPDYRQSRINFATSSLPSIRGLGRGRGRGNSLHRPRGTTYYRPYRRVVESYSGGCHSSASRFSEKVYSSKHHKSRR